MQNYGSIQKLLHDFIFNNKFVNKSLFELEKNHISETNQIRE